MDRRYPCFAGLPFFPAGTGIVNDRWAVNAGLPIQGAADFIVSIDSTSRNRFSAVGTENVKK